MCDNSNAEIHTTKVINYNNPTTITCNENLYLSSDHIYKMKFNYKYTLFSDNQILGKPYILINMTTATDNEYNKIGTQIVFKIEEILKVIEVGNHIQCQSQHYFLVNDYQSRISSEIANLNEAENSCRILLEQSTKYTIKLAGPTSIINNGTTSHSTSPSRNEIEDDFSGQPEPGTYSGQARIDFRNRIEFRDRRNKTLYFQPESFAFGNSLQLLVRKISYISGLS